MIASVDLDLEGPTFLADPYPVYAELRSQAPVRWHAGIHRWLVSRYADVDACFRDERFSSDRAAALTGLRSPAMQAEIAPLIGVMKKQVAFCDPPDHTRLRALLNHALTPRVVERLRPFIQQTTERLLDACVERGEMDLVENFAYPLPVALIARLLGLPDEDQSRLRPWSQAAMALLGGLNPNAGTERTALARMSEAALYILARYQRLLFQPRDDSLLSVLVQATEQGDRLTNEEVMANVVLIISAGHETVTQLISMGVLSLMRNRGQWERLKAEPSLVETAVEELLRYESPFQFVTRTACEDAEISGAPIRAGETVMLLLGSANRDEEVFERPDLLDIGRASNRHVAFGRGIHFCLGAPLARLQAQIALTTLARRLPELRLATNSLEWVPNFEFRGVKALPVTWSA